MLHQETSFLLFSHLNLASPPSSTLISATSGRTTTRPQLPSLFLSLQPQKPQPTSTWPNTLIIYGSRKRIHKHRSIPCRLFCQPQWVRGFARAHQCAEAKDLLIYRVESPYRLQPFFFRGPPISLFLLFLVFFPHPSHHYLDKLLTLPEKLNYINNSTMKILFPSETHTAANKNLPDFHQAT